MASEKSSLPLLTGFAQKLYDREKGILLALAPESSINSTLNEHLLTLRTRANNVRSLFPDELCNFSTNSWADDQKNANELGFCVEGVVWVDPSSITLGCGSDL
jgi:hypothetical protein